DVGVTVKTPEVQEAVSRAVAHPRIAAIVVAIARLGPDGPDVGHGGTRHHREHQRTAENRGEQNALEHVAPFLSTDPPVRRGGKRGPSASPANPAALRTSDCFPKVSKRGTQCKTPLKASSQEGGTRKAAGSARPRRPS